MLVGADADMIDSDDLGHLLQTVDVFLKIGKKCQTPIEPPVSAIARACSRLTCRPVNGVGPIAWDPTSAVCDSSRGFVATSTAWFTMPSVARATSQTKPSRLQTRITSAPNEVSPWCMTAPVWNTPVSLGV